MEGNKTIDNKEGQNGQGGTGNGNNGTGGSTGGTGTGGTTGGQSNNGANVSGNNGGTGVGNTTGSNSAGGNGTVTAGYTKEQLDAAAANSLKQGKAQIFQELGLDPTDEKTVAMIKAMVASQKSDEQKAAEIQAATTARLAEADRRATLAEAKAEAMQLGAEPKFVEDVVTLAMSRMTAGSDLKTLVGEVKTKYPVWFGAGEQGNNQAGNNGNNGGGTVGQRGTGASVHGKGQNGNNGEVKGMGARLAAQRKPANKFSYWGHNK